MKKSKVLRNYFKKFYDLDVVGMSPAHVLRDFMKKKYDYDSDANGFIGAVEDMIENDLAPGGSGGDEQFINLINGTVEEFTITEDMMADDGYQGKYLWLGDRLRFCGCQQLTKINGLEYVSLVQNNCFTNTKALKKVDLPNAEVIGSNTSNPAVKDVIFGGSGVEELSLASATTICDGAANGALSLKYVYAPKARTIGNSFQGDSKLEHVYIGAECTSIGAAAFGGAGSGGSGLVIDCGFAEGAVSGAPWAATGATINYNVPDPGSLEAMKE